MLSVRQVKSCMKQHAKRALLGSISQSEDIQDRPVLHVGLDNMVLHHTLPVITAIQDVINPHLEHSFHLPAYYVSKANMAHYHEHHA